MQPDPRRWWGLALLSAAQFIVILDTSIVGVALPAIQTQLGFSAENLSWIFNAYVVAFGGLLLLGGKLSDVLGARRMFALGFIILTAASVLAGVASEQGVLIAGRAIQGIGAALIAPSALVLLMQLFAHDGRELGKAFGVWGAAAAAGGTAGVFLGGVITEWLSWPWTFLVNVPLGGLVLLLTPGLLPRVHGGIGRIDWLGAITITGALSLAVYAIVTTEPGNWSSPTTLLLLGVAALLFVGFIVLQAVGRQPLLPLAIFATPNLAAANLLMALLGAAWIPLWFYLNLYLQQVLGLTALYSGLALVPMTITIMVLMVWLSGRLVGRFGIKANLVAGLIAMAVALFLFTRVPVDGDFWVDVLPASLLAALGMALAYIPATMAGMSGVRPEQTGLASGLISTTYQIGSAIGLAAMVAVAAAQSNGGTELLAGFQAAFFGAMIIAGVGVVGALLFIRGTPAGQTAAAE